MTTVLLNRPASRADRLIGELSQKGHDVINAPVTEIVGVDEPTIPPLDGISGMLFSSAAAVPHVPEAVKAACAGLPCLAVGPVTADALTENGWSDVQHFGGEMPELLAALLRGHAGGGWLYACGQQLAHSPADMAALSGANIMAMPVYEARVLPDWTVETLQSMRAQAIEVSLFLSVRTAHLVVEQVTKAGLWPGGAPGVAGCISAAVAKAIIPLGYDKIIVSPEKTTSSLVAAMGLS